MANQYGMPAGPGQPHLPPALPMHHQSRRQQEYHVYHHGPPQSPMHPHVYNNFHQPYYHSPPSAHPPQRWHNQPPYPQQQYYMPPPQAQMPYQPRSPMVVSSQPHHVQNMPNITRHTPLQAAPSPRPIPQHLQQQIPPPFQPQNVQSPLSPTSQQTIKESPLPSPSLAQPTGQSEAETAVSQSPLSRRESQVQNPLSFEPELRDPFYPSLPWYSPECSAADFPIRSTPKRRRRQNLRQPTESVALPTRDELPEDASVDVGEEPSSEASTIPARSEGEAETPATSNAPSESDFTPAVQAAVASPKAAPTQQHARKDTRSAIAVPNIPMPKAKPTNEAAEKPVSSPPASEATVGGIDGSSDAQPTAETSEQAAETAKPAPAKAAPKSWADLVRTKGSGGAAPLANGVSPFAPASVSMNATLADALKQYNVQHDSVLSFLEPRGLVNTGNMCYMNSILQVLVFCVPFYSFLDSVRQRTVHSMKSDTPLVDAMIMFMREFKVLASAESVDTIRKLLKAEQLEQYGEPVTPEYVYDAIRKLSRFQTMRRGHQQDAEEFLGFLLEGLHEECVAVMAGQSDAAAQEESVTSPSGTGADGWLEVGPKQKAAVTRTAGQEDVPSPVTKIFGGHLRSELRVPGSKDSVTLEPYKPLQLDIGAPHVNNIVDALKGLTRVEALTGDFGGKSTTAKKQVFIDTLPPILILHLKRFQYENNVTGTQKIWKKVGYPLELEIPKDVFPPSKRGGLAVKGGLPKYRLTGVVYHHGKSAAGGHYTVDILRQDSREWIRMDDTIIRRVRPEDVAEGGAEEDPKLLAKALEQHKADQDLQKQRNMYQGLDEAEREPEEEKPWSEVNGHVGGGKKWSSVATTATNGSTTPNNNTSGKRTPTNRKEGVKGNKVAYILLYERIRP